MLFEYLHYAPKDSYSIEETNTENEGTVCVVTVKLHKPDWLDNYLDFLSSY